MTVIAHNRMQWLFGLMAVFFIAVAGLAAYTDEYLLVAIPFAGILFYTGWQHRNSVFLLLLLSLPFSFEYNFSSGLGTDIPDEFLMLFVSLLFIACWLYYPKSISPNMLRHPLLIFLVIAISWTLISSVFSTNPVISIKYLLAKGWYIGAFVLAPLLVLYDKKQIRIAAMALAGSMLLVTTFVLIRHYGTGFSFATINKAVSPFFRNHVNYSAMLVCILPVWVAFFYGTKNKKSRVFLAAVILIILLALFFSYARGAWLALLAGAIAFWLIKRRWLFYKYILGIIFTIGLLFWIKEDDRYLQYAHDYKGTIFHENFSEHFIATYQLKDVSTAERFYRWIAGVRMIKDNWLTGYGPNTFYENYKCYAVPAYKTWVSDNPEHSTVHNYFLLTAIEQGIPGLVFLLLLLGVMFWYAQHLYQRVSDPFYKTVAAVTGVMLTMIMVLNFWSDLIETDKVGSLFFLCLSILLMTDIQTRKKSDPSPDIQRIP